MQHRRLWLCNYPLGRAATSSFIVIGTMMLPGQVTLVPLYVIFAKLGWTNSYLPMIVPTFFASYVGSWSGAFFIFLLRQFYLGILKTFVDAASRRRRQ